MQSGRYFVTFTIKAFLFTRSRPGGKATFDAEALVIKSQMVQKDPPKSNGTQPVKVNPYF